MIDLSISRRSTSGAFDKTIIESASFQVDKDEVLTIVGETGAGKSSICLAVLGLLGSSAAVEGSAYFGGQDLLSLTPRQLLPIRGAKLSMVFQDPVGAFNPVYTVGNQIASVIRAHSNVSRRQAKIMAMDLLEKVGLAEPESTARKYPHEFSGGMIQRAMIALSIANGPELILADEPTSSLDSASKEHVIAILKSLRQDIGAGMILVTHDFGLAARHSDRTMLLTGKTMVEQNNFPSDSPSQLLQPNSPAETAVSKKVSSALPRSCANRSCGQSAERPNSSEEGGEICSSTKILKVKELEVAYGQRSVSVGRKANPKQVLKGVSLEIAYSERVGLSGPSGAGKTTLAGVIAGLIKPSSGLVTLGGVSLPAEDRRSKRALMGRVQMVFQNPLSALNPKRQVSSAVAEPLIIQGFEVSEAVTMGLAMLNRVGLDGSLGQCYPGQLSGGQQQLVAIARALVSSPSLLVLDEPAASLHPDQKLKIMELIDQLRDETGLAYLLISHDGDLLNRWVDRVVTLETGSIVPISKLTRFTDSAAT